MSLKISISVSAILIILQACTNLDHTVDRNVRLFDELAFGGPYDNDLSHAERLVKWDGPIRVFLVGDGADRYQSEVMDHLDGISKLTGLSVRLDQSQSAETNYLVQFSPKIGFAIRKDFVRCSVRVHHKNGTIEKVRLNISTAAEHAVTRCITHEIMHSLGFRYHSGLARSVLSPAHGENDFTRCDEIMLMALYSDGLSPGLSRAEALTSVRGLIEKALAE